ncbi:MAG TPA: PHB depolymerase family esterase [Flavobacteriales bacterium]|nr:PHB depolymerase family esterase [Flavobacteriales bacterium]
MKSFILVLLTACGLNGIAQTTVIDSFVHDGVYRNYRIYVPAIYSGSQPVPLVLNLHGYTSNALEQEFYGDLRPIADTANFILVHPNGTGPAGGQYWNAYTMGSPNDVGFIEALIDSISVQYNINANRIYTCGMSNGGIMSYFLAENLNHKFAAMGSVTGSMTNFALSTCTPPDNIPVIEIHGTADGSVPYNGDGTFAPIDSIIDFWVGFNNCNPVPTVIPYPNTSTSDGCTATEYAYTGGTGGSEVVLVKITGGGHSWPNAPVLIDVTNFDFDASVRLWQFFMQFDKNQFIGVTENTAENELVRVFPNPASTYAVITGVPNGQTVRVFNLMGETVFDALAQGHELTLPVQHWQKGLYLVVTGSQKRKLVLN